MSGMPLLSYAIWVPIFAGLLVLATGSDRNAPLARMLALVGALAGFAVTIPLYTGFDMTTRVSLMVPPLVSIASMPCSAIIWAA